MGRDQFRYLADYRMLRRHTDQFHQLVDTGEFWRKPYQERRKIIARIKRLYNRLLMPFGVHRLQPILAAAGFLAIGSCSLFNDPPSVTIAEGDQSVKQGHTATFTALASDPNEDSVSLAWSINGETLAGETGESVSLSYEQTGQYAVQVTADDGIEQASAQVVLTVTPAARNPAFAELQVNPFGLETHRMNLDYGHATLADLDGDGDLDLYELVWDENVFAAPFARISLRENIGSAASPQFGSPVLSPHGLVAQPYNAQAMDFDLSSLPAFADLDNDGDLDAVAYYYDRDSAEKGFAFIENTGSPTEPSFAAPIIGHAGLPSVVAKGSSLVDIDADGDYDLAYFGEYESPLAVWFSENTGTAELPVFQVPSIAPLGTEVGDQFGPPRIDFGDIDDDGDLDLFVGGYTSSPEAFVSLYENTGTAATPSFAAGARNPFGIEFSVAGDLPFGRPVLGDLDSDGDLDMIAGYFWADISSAYYDVDLLFAENTNL